MGRHRIPGLSERQRTILHFIERYIERNGFSPSIREMADYANISSTSVVTYYLKQLEREGYIEREGGVSRGVRVVKQSKETDQENELKSLASIVIPMQRIPILGRIVAGRPIPIPATDFSYFDPETVIDLPTSMLPQPGKGLFALEVQGDSMIDAMVNQGDIIILSRDERAKNGEMVAAWIKEGGEITLKYFFKESDRIRLQPANPAYQPIFVDQPGGIEVQGKVVMVIRRLAV
jgi:repressor LexA